MAKVHSREAPFTDSLKKILSSLGAKVVKTHGNIYAVAGTPDLFGVWQGIPFLIECKNAVGKVEELQELEMQDWRKAGAVVLSARTKKEALTVLAMEFQRRGGNIAELLRRI